MKRILQTVGVLLLFSPFIALVVRLGSDLAQPDGISRAVGMLFQSRMILMFGWAPFVVGVVLVCIGTFAVNQKQKQHPQQDPAR